jgi:hypothetical protein
MDGKQQVVMVLRKTFQGGIIKRIPKNGRDARILLALAAASFDPGKDYSEPQANEQISEWKAGFTCPDEMDHVTIRRWLVDYHLLIRDADGSSYRANQMVINSVITPDARSIQPRYILEDVQRVNEDRRRRYQTSV